MRALTRSQWKGDGVGHTFRASCRGRPCVRDTASALSGWLREQSRFVKRVRVTAPARISNCAASNHLRVGAHCSGPAMVVWFETARHDLPAH